MELSKRKTQTQRKLPLIKTLFVTLLATVAMIAGGVSVAFADAGDPPVHGKSLIVNPDGTYTLALSVTGDAEKVTEPVNTNVIVILDTSGSMDENTGNTETTYTPSNQNANNMYGTNDGETFFPIYRHGGGFFNPYYYTIGQSAQSERYTGQRYLRQVANQTRLEAAQDAINDLAEALLSKNGQDGNPSDLIEMALVTFDTTARVSRTPTTSLTQFQNAVNNTEAGGGTNWEASLNSASGINFNDDDQTFVIFVSDGNPTFRTTQNGWNDRYQAGVYGTGQETNQNVTRCYTTAVPAAQALANKVTPGNFFTIGAYGNVDRMQDLTTDAGAPAGNYFSAGNTAALQEALASILEKIEMAGIAEAEIQDGTTNQVATASSGTVSLLSVDTSSYKYYRAGGTTEDGAVKYNPDANTATTADGETLKLGEEWTGSDVPAATFEDSAVNWDLTPIGVLEDDVTYTVTFNVWPSQTTLDYIADIENGLYDTLPAEVQKYIDEEGNLQTNTEATLTWVDTRDGSEGSEAFVNPDPVSSSAVEQLTVAKEWENDVDGQTSAPIELEVTRDGTHKYDVILSSDNNWKGNIYISIGIMRTGDDGDMEILAEGHDFTFVEPEDIGYRWELDVPVVHPMLIDGTLTMLTKVDDAHPAPSGADTYTINGATYYVSGGSDAELTATNYRRSQLVLTKAVTGEDVPEDATFPFTLTVNNSKADEGSEDNPNSDYWVWFTTIDDSGDNTDEVTVTGATKEADTVGWYHVASGTSFSVDLPAGYSVRFINLPKDSTYTFAEGTLGTGFIFEKAELTGDDESFKGGQTSTGTIADWNNEYVVTYTNIYELTSVTVYKVWVDESNAYESRPETLALTLNAPQDVDVPDPTITKSEDGNTWTYTWSGLPKKDASGDDYEYTVSEDTVPAGYTKSPEAAVEDDGTITNTYAPTAVEFELKAGKKLDAPQGSNAPDVTGQYDLVLEAAEGVPMPANAASAEDGTQTVTMKNKDGNGGMDSFGAISYTKPGVYQYKVSEEGSVAGVTNGTDSYTVAVTVEVDKTDPGKLTATAKVGEKATNEVLFTNTYFVTPAKATIKVTKVLEGAELAGGAYSFELFAEGGEEPLQTKTNADDGTVTFDEITYEATGEYKYTIKEVKGDKDYITYDEGTANVTVSVSDNGEGELVAEVSVDKDTFTNKYTATGQVDITASKQYNRDDLAVGDFTFTLVGDGDVNQTKTNAADGKVAFDTIEYTLDDLKETTEVETTVSYKEVVDGDTTTYVNVDDDTDVLDALPEGAKLNEETGNYDVTTTETVTTYKDEATFVYTMKEVAGDKDYITYDKHEVTVTVTVKNVGEGKLEATPSYEGSTTFVNTYSASGSIELEGKKVLEGRDLAEGQFTFQLLDKDNKVLGETTNDANGEFAFSDLEDLSFTEANDGETYTFYIAEVNDNKKGYTYDTDKREVTVTVADEGDGTLSFEITGDDELEFVNTFEPVPVEIDPPVVKIIKGNPPADAEFTYQMKAVEPTDAPMPEGAVDGVITITKSGAGEYEFGWITYTEPGEFMYELSELNDGKENWVYDATKYFLAVVVSEDEDGNLVESHAVVDSNQNSVDKATFTNEYTEEPIVPKTGDDLAGVIPPLVAIAVASGLLALGVGRRMRKDR